MTADDKADLYHGSDADATAVIVKAIRKARVGISQDIVSVLKTLMYKGGFESLEEAKAWLARPLGQRAINQIAAMARKRLGKKDSRGIIERLCAPSKGAYIDIKEGLNTVLRINEKPLAEAIQKGSRPFLEKVVTHSWGHEHFEIQQGTGIGVAVDSPPVDMMHAVVSKAMPTSARTVLTNVVIDEVRTIILEGITQGKSTYDIAEEVATKYGTEVWRAKRIVRTMMTEASAEAELNALADEGFDEYDYMCTLDEKTCPKCGALDGKTFKTSERAVNINFPPMHPNCRCTITCHMEDWEREGIERAARDENGANVDVPATMTYEEWAKKYYPAGAKALGKAVKTLPPTPMPEPEPPKPILMEWVPVDETPWAVKLMAVKVVSDELESRGMKLHNNHLDEDFRQKFEAEATNEGRAKVLAERDAQFQDLIKLILSTFLTKYDVDMEGFFSQFRLDADTDPMDYIKEKPKDKPFVNLEPIGPLKIRPYNGPHGPAEMAKVESDIQMYLGWQNAEAPDSEDWWETERLIVEARQKLIRMKFASEVDNSSMSKAYELYADEYWQAYLDWYRVTLKDYEVFHKPKKGSERYKEWQACVSGMRNMEFAIDAWKRRRDWTPGAIADDPDPSEAVEIHPYDGLRDVLAQDGMSESNIDMALDTMQANMDRAPVGIQNAWKRYEDLLRLETASSADSLLGNASYFSPSFEGTRVNQAEFINMPLNIGGDWHQAPPTTVYFHESGHQLAFMMAQENFLGTTLPGEDITNKYRSPAYGDRTFSEVIRDDMAKFLEPYIRRAGGNPSNFDTPEKWLKGGAMSYDILSDVRKQLNQEFATDWMGSQFTSDFSDMLGWYTHNQITFKWGHFNRSGEEYYWDYCDPGVEMFAEITSAYFANPSSLAFLKEHMPDTVGFYNEMVYNATHGADMSNPPPLSDEAKAQFEPREPLPEVTRKKPVTKEMLEENVAKQDVVAVKKTPPKVSDKEITAIYNEVSQMRLVTYSMRSREFMGILNSAWEEASREHPELATYAKECGRIILSAEKNNGYYDIYKAQAYVTLMEPYMEDYIL